MNKMKRKRFNPEREFNWGSEDFRLVTESTLDGERIRRENERKEQSTKEAELNQPVFL